MKNKLNIEKELFQAISIGNERAFETLYETFRTQILSIAFHFTKNEILSDEITQDVFVSVWIYRNRLSEVNDPGGYMYTMVANKTIEVLKKQKRLEQSHRNFLESNILLQENEVENKLAIKENEQLLQDWIEQLPPKQKEVYLLRRREQYSIEETAQHLNISVFTVKNHLKAANRFLKKKFLHHHGGLLILILSFFLKK